MICSKCAHEAQLMAAYNDEILCLGCLVDVYPMIASKVIDYLTDRLKVAEEGAGIDL